MSLPKEDDLIKACQEKNISAAQHCFQQIILSDDANAASELLLQAQPYLTDSIADTLIDTIWLQSSMTEEPSQNEFLVTLLQKLAAFLPHAKLLTTLDAALLQASNVIASEADLQKKIKLLNTQLYYRQDKFNLLVEESEGYSKYLHYLQTCQLDNVWECIGTFHLDPNRCLDLAIDVLEQQYFASSQKTPESLVQLIQQLPTCKLPVLLGFKLSGRSDNNTKPLLRCMAYLVEEKVLSIRDMLTYMPPDWLTLLDETYDKLVQLEQKKLKAMGKVKLSSSSNDGETKEETIDLQPLRQTLVIQWVHIFVDRLGWYESLTSVFEEHWNKLCVLFPKTIGAALCDCAQKDIDATYKAKVPQPWKSSEDTIMSDTSSSLDDLLGKISKPLLYTQESGSILLRPILYTQLCRLFCAFIPDGDMSESAQDFLRSFLLPSLSLFPPNPAQSMELWNVLKLVPYRTRYALYRAWRGSGLERAALRSLDKPVWLIQGELQAGKDIRYALKRLSKDTIRDTSRAVAKVCQSHPLVVFTTILNQIESYDNLVQVMVDSLRFATPLSLDVLGFCILSRLSGSTGGVVNRSRLKEDGVNVSQWLQSLESFTGALYKRFPFLELRGILCYLMSRLKDGHVMELGVLRTLLKTAGGWAFADYAPAASLSTTQLQGRAGSTVLKRETMSFGVIEDCDSHASNEIRRVLQSDDVGISLLILLAQLRHQIVFGRTSGQPKPVKLIGYLVDTCQVIMAILLDFLTDDSEEGLASGTITKYALSMPPLVDLQKVYGLDTASAWMLCRPLIRAASADVEEFGEVQDDGSICDADVLSKFKPTEASRKAYKEMLPEGAWSHVSAELFETFFSNMLYDLFCPEEIYRSEIARLEKEEERLARQLKSSSQQLASPRLGAPAGKKDEEELERVKKAGTTLTKDSTKHGHHVSRTVEQMEEKSKAFFASEQVSEAAAMTFLTRCVYPRCMQGPDDAMYCAYFISMLHKMESPGFGTLHLFDSMIVALSRALFGLTEGEAANVSILLFEVWKTVSRWRYDETAFNAELLDKPGSIMVKTVDGVEKLESMSRKEYEVLYNKWHAAIGAAAIGALQSSEYMHKRNYLIVLTRMVEVYPTRPKLGNKLLKTLEPLQDESSSFADIRASAQAYSTQLLKARDEGVWTEEDAATVKKRMEKDQKAAAARAKRAEEQMEEIKRESEKITEEIGWDSRPRGDRRGREYGRPPPNRDLGSGLDDSRRGAVDGGRRGGPEDGRRGPPDDGRRVPPPNPNARNFEPSRRERTLSQEDRRGGPPPPREAPRDERWPRDRGPDRGPGRGDAYTAGAADRRRDGPPSGRDEGPHRGREEHRGLEGRFEPPARSGRSTTGAKRSREPSVEPGESSREDQRSSKRARTDTAAKEEGGRRGDDAGRRGGGRRKVRRS